MMMDISNAVILLSIVQLVAGVTSNGESLGVVSPDSLCQCYRCDSEHTAHFRTYTTGIADRLSDPKLLWQHSFSPVYNKTGFKANCISVARFDADGSQVICTYEDDAAPSSATSSISFDMGGKVLWTSNNASSTSTYPLGLGETVVMTNGLFLTCLKFPDGSRCGEKILIEPPLKAPVLHPHVTTNGVMIFLSSQDGTIAGYLTNGVPHFSFIIRDTIANVTGTFAARSHPVIQENTVYITASFIPNDGIHVPPTCRVYALEVRRTINERLVVQWYKDYTCPSDISAELQPTLIDSSDNFWLPGSLPGKRCDLVTVQTTSTEATCRQLQPQETKGSFAGFAAGANNQLVAARGSSVILIGPGDNSTIVNVTDVTGGKIQEIVSESVLVRLDSSSRYNITFIGISSGDSPVYVTTIGVDSIGSTDTQSLWSVPIPGVTSVPATTQIVPICSEGSLCYFGVSVRESFYVFG